ncbi:ABC transporter substrate-binding protein [Fluviispira multicolorata]|uniref:Transporter substrate-binding domain-containing protein n=1 Tax=Fluviispira multicolorata TaxID=2654512 RepID=A0A833JF23_9BACT|nr:ABC transporter substrate-binding protein [Fluviispira multicolorata]KAB8033499.1 transporter substrate-binding domain-containing protein [Fluviispira multicolorata]
MKLNRRFFLVALSTLTFLSFTKQSYADVTEIKKKGSIIVGVKDSLYPFGFVDEKTRRLQGYDIDFANEIGKKLGVKVELKAVTSANRIPLLSEENVDLLICTMTITPERAKEINFSYPYFISKQKFIVKKGSVKSLKDLDDKKIGTTKGSTSEKNAAAKLPNAKIISYDDYPQAYLAMQQEKVFAITTDESILAGILSRSIKKKDFELSSFDISKEPYGVGVNKKNPELLKIVNQTLLEMEKNGKANETFTKWFGPKSQVPLVRDFKIVP